jgi:hypothetical protein
VEFFKKCLQLPKNWMLLEIDLFFGYFDHSSRALLQFEFLEASETRNTSKQLNIEEFTRSFEPKK